MRTLAGKTATILAAGAAVLAVYALREGLLLLVLAMLCGAAAEAPIASLTARGLPRWLAITIIYTLALGIGLGTAAFLVVTLPGELHGAIDAIGRAYTESRSGWLTHGFIGPLVAEQLPAPGGALGDGTLAAIGRAVVGVGAGALEVAASLAIALLLSLLWSFSAPGFERLWLSLLSPRDRARPRATWHHVYANVGAQIRHELTAGMLTAIVAGVGFRLAGIPYAELLALAIALLRAIPFAGPLLAIALAALGGAMRGPFGAVGAASGATLVLLSVHTLLRARSDAGARPHPTLTVLVLIALWELGGLPAMLAALPLAGAIHALASQLAGENALPAPSRRLPELRRRLDTVLARTDEPELASLAGRLAAIVEEATEAERHA